jgi:hypothetical protein
MTLYCQDSLTLLFKLKLYNHTMFNGGNVPESAYDSPFIIKHVCAVRDHGRLVVVIVVLVHLFVVLVHFWCRNPGVEAVE